jgi:hypothetical protein
MNRKIKIKIAGRRTDGRTDGGFQHSRLLSITDHEEKQNLPSKFKVSEAEVGHIEKLYCSAAADCSTAGCLINAGARRQQDPRSRECKNIHCH